MNEDMFRLLDCISNVTNEEFESIEVLKNTVIALIKKYFGTLSSIEDLNNKIYIEIPGSNLNFIFDIKKEGQIYKINEYNLSYKN